MYQLKIGLALVAKIVLHIAVGAIITAAGGIALYFADQLSVPTWVMFIEVVLFVVAVCFAVGGSIQGCSNSWLECEMDLRKHVSRQRRWKEYAPGRTKERWESLLP